MHTDNQVDCVIAGVVWQHVCVGHVQVPEGRFTDETGARKRLKIEIPTDRANLRGIYIRSDTNYLLAFAFSSNGNFDSRRNGTPRLLADQSEWLIPVQESCLVLTISEIHKRTIVINADCKRILSRHWTVPRRCRHCEHNGRIPCAMLSSPLV